MNIVASASFGGALDLEAIAGALEGARYDSNRFPGVIYRLKDPKSTVLLFKSGKAVCTGAHSLAAVDAAMRELTRRLEAAGVAVRSPPVIEVQNIVATGDLGKRTDPKTVALVLGSENAEYEPEVFPGLVHRMDAPKVVLLIFATGKVICVGAKTIEDAQAAVDKLTRILSARGVL